MLSSIRCIKYFTSLSSVADSSFLDRVDLHGAGAAQDIEPRAIVVAAAETLKSLQLSDMGQPIGRIGTPLGGKAAIAAANQARSGPTDEIRLGQRRGTFRNADRAAFRGGNEWGVFEHISSVGR